MADAVAMDAIQAMGGAATPIPWGELYTSLQQGVVDAADWGTESMNHRMGFFEIAKHSIRIGHSMPSQEFAVNKAKQFVPVTPDGYVIGDVILFYLAENEFSLVGRAPAIEWVEFHAQYHKPDGSKWDVTDERDERTAMRTDGKRKNYRFQLQGPNAMKILSTALGQQAPDLKFFNMAHIGIAGKDVIALRHGISASVWPTVVSPAPSMTTST